LIGGLSARRPDSPAVQQLTAGEPSRPMATPAGDRDRLGV